MEAGFIKIRFTFSCEKKRDNEGVSELAYRLV